MYKRNKSTTHPLTAHKHFLLHEICGRWVSCGGDRSRMPDVQIYHTGAQYRIKFSYDPQTVYYRPVQQWWGVASFYLYGRVGLAYDAERDILTLSDYGDYQRADG
jgi:hypothetical protein